MPPYATPVLLVAGIFTALSFFHVSLFDVSSYKNASLERTYFTESNTEEKNDTPPAPDTRPVVKHVPLPKAVKSIYMSSCVVGTRDFRQRLIDLTNETEINSIVIDIKD
jgi:hypothetical protein